MNLISILHQKLDDFSHAVLEPISKTEVPQVAKEILNISMAATTAWLLKTVFLAPKVSFIGFTTGSIFGYSLVREIWNDFSSAKRINTLLVAQGVIVICARLLSGLLPWGIVFSSFAGTVALGVYTRELVTPPESDEDHLHRKNNSNVWLKKVKNCVCKYINQNYLQQSKEFAKYIYHQTTGITYPPQLSNEENLGEKTMRISKIALYYLSIFIPFGANALLNLTLAHKGPNTSSWGFFFGLIFPQRVKRACEDITKNKPNTNTVSLIGAAFITMIFLHKNNEMMRQTAIFAASACLGKHTYTMIS